MKDPDRPGPAGETSPYVDPRRQHDGGGMGQFAGVGLQFAASLILFLYLGQWIDRKLGTAPWFLLLGVFVGGGASFYSIYRKLMAAQEREERERAAEKARQRGERPS